MRLIHGECLAEMKLMEDNSIDLICTDPPYFKVKGEYWDHQWDTSEGFIEWIGELCAEWQRLLKPNGSLYVFASPKMSARVEVEIGRWFNVLNCVRWEKEAGWHNKNRPEDLRSMLSPWESIIFAEHFNSDNIAKGEAGYNQKCDELRGFVFEPLRAYICNEYERAGMLNTQGKIDTNVACGFSASSGGMASRHYFSRSQWCLPTEEHYKKMQGLLNNGTHKYLRREYEDLRQEYEELRRPFNATPNQPYTDVWTFKTVTTYKGKHPCEKPLEMMRHIVRMSSRPGATVLDCFMGSGSTGQACKLEGREFVGIEMDDKYFERAQERLSQKLLI